MKLTSNYAVPSRGIVAGLCVAVLAAFVVAVPVWAQKIGTMDQPSISCVLPPGQVSLEISFATPAPGTGAPAGFSLQWMTREDFVDNGEVWFSSSDPRLCKGSFSGNAFGHYYNVPAGSSTSVQIGDVIFDNPGASSNCASEPLECGTAYVFRAFSHATSKLKRSEWSADLVCSTAACPRESNCTYTQGYWKTHGPSPTGNNTNEWPVAELSLGSVLYTETQLQAILDKPAAGNGLITLAHQLIAAKLNIENGASAAAIAASIAAADTMIGSRVVPPVGSGSLAPSATSALVQALTNYNEGTTGPGHCG